MNEEKEKLVLEGERINKLRKNKKINKKERKAIVKAFAASLKKNSKEAIKAKDPNRRVGILMLRDSKYPMEFTLHNHNVYLNPLKKMIKGEKYKNSEHQDILNGIIRDFIMKQQAAQKIENQPAEVKNGESE